MVHLSLSFLSRPVCVSNNTHQQKRTHRYRPHQEAGHHSRREKAIEAAAHTHSKEAKASHQSNAGKKEGRRQRRAGSKEGSRQSHAGEGASPKRLQTQRAFACKASHSTQHQAAQNLIRIIRRIRKTQTSNQHNIPIHPHSDTSYVFASYQVMCMYGMCLNHYYIKYVCTTAEKQKLQTPPIIYKPST